MTTDSDPQSSAEEALARYQARVKLVGAVLTTFITTVFGTLAVAYFTFVSDTQENTNVHDKGYRDFVAKFIDVALEEDIYTRQRFAEYFATVILDDKQRGLWGEYLTKIENLIKKEEDALRLAADLKTAEDDDERRKLEVELNTIQRQLQSISREATKPHAGCASVPDAPARAKCIAESYIGLREEPGDASNPTIMQFASDLRMDSYSGDDIPWSGLFVGWVVGQTNPDAALPENPLMNRNWRTFGEETTEPKPGDIAVFWRVSPSSRQGHVGFFVGEDETSYHILGGNQSNSVNVTKMSKERLLGFRRIPASEGE